MKKGLILGIMLLVILGICVSLTNDTTNVSNNEKLTNVSSISDFEYSVKDKKITLKKYKGNDKKVIIAKMYKINKTNCEVTKLDNTIFNGCSANIVYLPKTIECIYDDTLAYLNAEHIDLYFEGTEKEWKKIFKKYEISSTNQKIKEGNMEEKGKELADKINKKIGHKYDKSKFTYHFETKVEDILY